MENFNLQEYLKNNPLFENEKNEDLLQFMNQNKEEIITFLNVNEEFGFDDNDEGNIVYSKNIKFIKDDLGDVTIEDLRKEDEYGISFKWLKDAKNDPEFRGEEGDDYYKYKLDNGKELAYIKYNI